jgi:hypothetical protein
LQPGAASCGVVSGVMTLAEAAMSSPGVAPMVVGELVCLGALPGEHGAVARAALEHVGRVLERRSSAAVAPLLRRHLRAVLARWLAERRALAAFPFSLFGERVTLASFVQEHGDVVLPQVCCVSYNRCACLTHNYCCSWFGLVQETISNMQRKLSENHRQHWLLVIMDRFLEQ